MREGFDQSGRDWRRDIRQRLAPLGLPAAQETTITEELAQDAEDRYAALLLKGVAGDEAAARILRDLDETRLAERLRSVPRVAAPAPVLGSSRGSFVSDAAQDLRYGLRTLSKSPLFAALAILTLTLGIGASTAMFSVLNAVLIAPLPFPEPDRLIQIWGARRDAGWTQASLSHANFWDLTDLARDFTEIGGITSTGQIGRAHV